MKAPPVLLFGGNSPVVAYLRHSMMVWLRSVETHVSPEDVAYCLSGSVPTHDESKRRMELDSLGPLVSERADARLVNECRQMSIELLTPE